MKKNGKKLFLCGTFDVTHCTIDNKNHYLVTNCSIYAVVVFTTCALPEFMWKAVEEHI